MSEEFPFQGAGEVCRKHQRNYALSMIAGIPAILLIWSFVRSILPDQRSIDPLLLSGILWIPVIGLFAYRYIYWKCPKCGKSFHNRDGWYSNPWTLSCLNCGLAKYSGSTFETKWRRW